MAPIRNPRRVALGALRDIVRFARVMIRTWDEGQTTYDVVTVEAADGRTIRNHQSRPRRDDEKIENHPKAWEQLASYAAGIESIARDLRGYAERKARAAESRQALPPLPGGKFL